MISKLNLIKLAAQLLVEEKGKQYQFDQRLIKLRKKRKVSQSKQNLYKMDKNTKIKSSSQLISKSLDNRQGSITESLCPKYRRFIDFEKPTKFSQSETNTGILTESLAQQSNTKDSTSLQQICPIATDKSQHKHTHSVSMIDINESYKIPPLDDKKLSVKINSLSKQNSITETSISSPLPNLKLRQQISSKIRYRESTVSEDELKYQIKDHFNQLNSIIEKTSTHFQKRMKTHQDQLLKIMMLEIKRVNEECEKTIARYNDIIKKKATNQQIDEARLQTTFFRTQALQLRKENQELKKEIKYLKRLNNEYELKIKTDSQTLKQMGIKLMNYKEKNKSIQRTLLDEVISKKSQKLKEINSQGKYNLKIISNQGSVIEGSKIACLTKINSKSLDNTDLTQFRSGQKSLGSMRMRTEFVSGTSSNPSLKNSLIMKLNRQISKKYKIDKTVEDFCSQTPSNKKQQSTENAQQNGGVETEANRQKIIRFLQEARPSIKSIIQQKKSTDKKPIRKLTQEPPIKNHIDKVMIIKNRVRLSTFEQQRWQQFKNNSIDLTIDNHEASQRKN